MRLSGFLVMIVLLGSLSQGQDVVGSPEAEGQLARMLRYVPDDAHLVIVVPNLDKFVQAAGEFWRAIGVEEPAGGAALSLLGESLGDSAAALDSSGPLIVAWSANRDGAVLIAALADREAWRPVAAPETLRAGVQFYEFGPDQYLVVGVGPVAIFGREREDLTRALDSGGKLARVIEREVGDLLKQRQLVVYADLDGWQASLESKVGMILRQVGMGIVAGSSDAESAVLIWEWMGARVRQLLVEARSAVLTLEFGSDGLFIDKRIHFEADGAVARYLAQVRKPGRDILRGMSRSSAAIVLAHEWEDGSDEEGLGAVLTRQMLTMKPVREKFGAERMDEVLKQNAVLMRMVSGTNVAFGFDGDDGLSYWGWYLAERGEDVQRRVGAIFESCPDLMSIWGSAPAVGCQSVKEDVGGVKADVYCFDFCGAGTPVQPMLQMMYGQKPALYMAARGKTGVAYSFGSRALARRRLVELLEESGGLLATDPRVIALFEHLSADPQFCVLVDLPRVVGDAGKLVSRMGVSVWPEIKVSVGEPLAGLTFYMERQSLRLEAYVPARSLGAVIKALKEAEGGEAGQ